MVLKNPYKVLLIVLFMTLLTGQSCVGMGIETKTKTAVPIATDAPELTNSVTQTPTSMITLTPIPPGVFALSFYSPLIMNYDTSVWKLVTMGSLQALRLETCQLAEVGPSGNFPSDAEPIQLGNVEYLFSFSEISTPGMTAALYIENQSVDGYDYDTGLPVLMILASQSEWDDCKALGEEVLSTLRSP